MGYDFGRPFRLKILSLMLDDGWMARYGGHIIQAEYFELADEIAFAQAVLNYRAAYGRSPVDIVDTIELMDGGDPKLAMKLYKGAKEWDLTLAADKAILFAREQAAKLAILEGVDDIEKGDIQAAIKRMEDALRVGEDIEQTGLDPYNQPDEWLYDYWSDKVPTGLMHADWEMEGGLGPGELGIILGSQNKGKSMALINAGYAAASVLGCRNVVHFTHEMPPKQVAKRYAARMLFRFPHRDDDLDKYSAEIVEAARMLIRGKVRIIGGSKRMSLPQLKGHLERLIAEGVEPGVVIDDYPDLLIPPTKRSERRNELSDIYTDLRGLSGQFGVPFWGASQGQRDSFNKEVININEVAEDINKASIADVIISICQTYDEEMMERCRLFMAKVRDGVSRAMIEAKFLKKSQAIVTTGYAEYKPPRNGKSADQ